MILKKVLLDRQDELGYFGRNIHKKGYITEIKSFYQNLYNMELMMKCLEE